MRALDADAKDVLCSRIEVDDQEVVVDKNDARAQTVKNTFGVRVARSVVARVPACFSA